MELIYAVRNASSVHLHQGATLVFQSSNQVNSAGKNGTPGFSTYDILYPRHSAKRGKARALPSFTSQLFMAETFAIPNTQVTALETPKGLDPDYFSAYAFYVNGKVNKLALVNLRPYYANSTSEHSIEFDLSKVMSNEAGCTHGWVKRLTAPYVNEKDTAKTTWAGQSYEFGAPEGSLDIETIKRSELLKVRGSQAALIFFDKKDVYGF